MNRIGHIKTALALSPLPFILLPHSHFMNNKITLYYNHFAYNLRYIFLHNLSHHIIYIALGLIIYLIGAVFPDYDFILRHLYDDKDKKKRYLYHRQFTHGLLLWVSLFAFVLYKYYYIHSIILFYAIIFILGILTHLIADMLTGTIPLIIYGKYYNTFSRIGITMFFKNKKDKPSKLNQFFVKKTPEFYDKAIIFYLILFAVCYFLIFLK